MKKNVEQVISEGVFPAQSIVDGVGEGSNGTVTAPAEDLAPVQFVNVSILGNESFVVEDKSMVERIQVECCSQQKDKER